MRAVRDWRSGGSGEAAATSEGGMSSAARATEPTQTAGVFARIRSGFTPPTKLTISEFSDRELVVTTGPLAGTHWQTSFAPYQRGILDAFHEPGVEYVAVRASSQ